MEKIASQDGSAQKLETVICEFGACGGGIFDAVQGAQSSAPPSSGWNVPLLPMPLFLIGSGEINNDPAQRLKRYAVGFGCKNSPQNRVLASMKTGAEVGAVRVGIIATATGSFEAGVGAVPGAIIGGFHWSACGPGASTFSQGPGAIALGGAATIGCVLAEPCGAVEGILAGIAVIGTAIGVQDSISQMSQHGRGNVSDTGIEG